MDQQPTWIHKSKPIIVDPPRSLRSVVGTIVCADMIVITTRTALLTGS